MAFNHIKSVNERTHAMIPPEVGKKLPATWMDLTSLRVFEIRFTDKLFRLEYRTRGIDDTEISPGEKGDGFGKDCEDLCDFICQKGDVVRAIGRAERLGDQPYRAAAAWGVGFDCLMFLNDNVFKGKRIFVNT